jgi:uncharacterized repeat protein (TIGR01451 family)
VPVPNSNEFTVGSTNLLNFFSTNSNFALRLNKASLAIRNVMRSPDIIGVQEVGDIGTLTALADKINADTVAAGGVNPNYQAYLLEGVDLFSDDIDVGFLVKSTRVNVVSVTQEGKGLTFTDPTEGDEDTLFERPPLILRANVRAPGGSLFPVTVVVNHMQSLIGVDDPVEGPRQRLKRKLQAEFTANLVQSLQGENLVLVGDFNSHQFNDGYVDVIGTIKGMPAPSDQVLLGSPDLVNPNLAVLVDTLPAAQRYSYIFDGHSQTIDHVLVDSGMLGRVSGFAYARNNADFPESLSMDGARSERLSDHDMPVAYFTFPPPSANLSINIADSPDPVMARETLTYTITVTNNGPDIAKDVIVLNSLPLGTNFVSCSATGGGVCGGLAILRTVTFQSLGIGVTETITITALVNGSTTLRDLAVVGSVTRDPDLSDNLAIEMTTVDRRSR